MAIIRNVTIYTPNTAVKRFYAIMRYRYTIDTIDGRKIDFKRIIDDAAILAHSMIPDNQLKK